MSNHLPVMNINLLVSLGRTLWDWQKERYDDLIQFWAHVASPIISVTITRIMGPPVLSVICFSPKRVCVIHVTLF